LILLWRLLDYAAVIAPLDSAQVAVALKAAGAPVRLEMLKIMQRDSFGVLELGQIFAMQQPAMSHHLKVMTRACLLDRRREGNSIFYRRMQNAEPGLQRVLEQIYATAELAALQKSVARRLARVQRVRKLRSQRFFADNAQRFHSQQDLIAGFTDYGATVRALMRHAVGGHWLEVGPGAGELLAAEMRGYQAVTALDNSAAMLSASRQRAGAATHIEFVLGEPADLLARAVAADCITCNMVLHHVPSPAAMLADMAQLLRPGGQMLITDLDAHDQEWAKTSCGDLWLGFSPDQLSAWARESGLVEGRSEYLALRNGFRVQVREFLRPADAL